MSWSKGLDKLALGKKGENLAEKFLFQQGLKILSRNYRTSQGELDIIAQSRQEIIFVEVKTRSSQKFGSPVEAVNHRKQEKLKQVAQAYLTAHRLENCPIRFDVVAIEVFPQGESKIEWLKGVL